MVRIKFLISFDEGILVQRDTKIIKNKYNIEDVEMQSVLIGESTPIFI
jgi:hypothetical protein